MFRPAQGPDNNSVSSPSACLRDGLIQKRDCVVLQYLLNLNAFSVEHVLELRCQCVVAAPDAHGNIKGERQIAFPGWDSHNFERDRLLCHEISCGWPPHNSNANISRGDRINDSARRI